MNSLFAILSFADILLFSVLSSARSQATGDSTARHDSVSQASRTIVDENGDGIDDRREQTGKARRRVRFVDEDGDGICDGRESGLGFKGATKDGVRKRRGGGK